MLEIPVLDHDAVLRAVTPAQAIERVGDALVSFHRGAWAMPPKMYLDSSPYGDFRAMPALGDGLALLKWVSSFPSTQAGPADGHGGDLPVRRPHGRAADAVGRAVGDSSAHGRCGRRRNPGACPGGCTIGGRRGLWAPRGVGGSVSDRGGVGPGVCHDVRPEAAAELAAELGSGWKAGSREEAVRCEVVCCITPGAAILIEAGDLRPGLHLNMLGADGPGKAEATIAAVASCALYCDEWEQASHGGELTGAVQAGLIKRDQVTELGAVLAGEAPGRPGIEAVTLFDSTGLAIQDLAVAAVALEAWRGGRVGAQSVRL